MPPRRGEKRVAGGKRSAATGTIQCGTTRAPEGRQSQPHTIDTTVSLHFSGALPGRRHSRFGCIRWPRFACHRLPSTSPSGAAQPQPTPRSQPQRLAPCCKQHAVIRLHPSCGRGSLEGLPRARATTFHEKGLHREPRRCDSEPLISAFAANESNKQAVILSTAKAPVKLATVVLHAAGPSLRAQDDSRHLSSSQPLRSTSSRPLESSYERS